MQSLTPNAQQAAMSPGQDIAWLFTIKWPDGSVTYSHRRVMADGVALPASLLDPGKLSMRPVLEFPRNENLQDSELFISIALDGSESPSLRGRLEIMDPEGLEVDWELLFLETNGQNSRSDAVCLFRGIISTVTIGRTSARLKCIDMISARSRRMFGRRLSHNEIPEPRSRMEGHMLPWVFGKPGEVQLLEWRTGQQLSLARSVGVDDAVIYFRSVEGLPNSGSIQIGDERLDYDVIDFENNSVGRLSAPLRRSEPACHSQGAPARLVPTGGFEWLAAGHACRSVTDLRAEGILIAPSQYSVTTEMRDVEIQKVNLAKWPCFVSYQANPSRSFLNETSLPGSWLISPLTTALNPGLALSEDGEMGTEMNSGAKLLKFSWQGNLANGRQRFGLLKKATLKGKIEATALWEPTTRLFMRLTMGTTVLSTSLPRPKIEDSPKYAAHTFELDLAPLVELYDWTLFDGAEGLGFTAELELMTGGDPTRFFISDFGVEVEFLARSNSRLADSITACVEGLEWEGGLLENPADIIRFILCDTRTLHIPLERINANAFAQAYARLDALGYVFSNHIANPVNYQALLGQLLFESRCRLVSHGELISLQFCESDSALFQSDFEFDPDKILRTKDLCLERSPLAETLSRVQLRSGVDFTGEEMASFRKFLYEDSFAAYPANNAPERDFVSSLEWHNHGDASPVADLARFLIRRHAFRRQRLQIAAPLAAVSLQPGDRVALYDDYFPLGLDQGEVQRMMLEKPHYMVVDLSFPMPGQDCWVHSPSAFIRTRGCGSLMEIWINGRVVATLRWDGLMQLGGTVREECALYGAMAGPAEFREAESRLYFGTGAAGNFTPRFTIDSSGNLLLAGKVVEELVREDLLINQAIQAAPQHLAMGPAANAMAPLVYDAALQELQIQGFIVESDRF